MLDKEQLDAVIVASHPEVHTEVLKVTLPRGLPTFIEKPPTLTTSDLEDLIQINHRWETITAVGLNFSFTEAVSSIKRIMSKKEFGDLQYLRICHYNNKPVGDLWGQSNHTRSFLLSQVIHPLGLLYDFGEDAGIAPSIHRHNGDSGVLFSVHTRLRSRTGGNLFTASILTSSTSPFFDWEMQVISTTGIVINIDSLWEIEVFSDHPVNPLVDNQKWWRTVWQPSPLSGGFKRNGYEHQFAAFFNDIDNKKRGFTSIEALLPIYALIDMMETTHAS